MVINITKPGLKQSLKPLFIFSQKYYSEENGSKFSLNEEVSPNGITHGGYGYLDKNGDLVYVEYEKDKSGSV